MTTNQILRDALQDERNWLESQRKAISKGCGSSWDMLQCDERMDLIDAALGATGAADAPGAFAWIIVNSATGEWDGGEPMTDRIEADDYMANGCLPGWHLEPLYRTAPPSPTPAAEEVTGAADERCALYTPENWQVRDWALEEAAKACENERVEEIGEGDISYNYAIKHASDAIRALKSSPAPNLSIPAPAIDTSGERVEGPEVSGQGSEVAPGGVEVAAEIERLNAGWQASNDDNLLKAHTITRLEAALAERQAEVGRLMLENAALWASSKHGEQG